MMMLSFPFPYTPLWSYDDVHRYDLPFHFCEMLPPFSSMVNQILPIGFDCFFFSLAKLAIWAGSIFSKTTEHSFVEIFGFCFRSEPLFFTDDFVEFSAFCFCFGPLSPIDDFFSICLVFTTLKKERMNFYRKKIIFLKNRVIFWYLLLNISIISDYFQETLFCINWLI